MNVKGEQQMSKRTVKTIGGDVTPDCYSALPTKRLDAFIKSHVSGCERLQGNLTRHSTELYCALQVMEGRYEKQERFRTDIKELKAPGWHQYLKSRGVEPSTYRKWKQRQRSLVKTTAVDVVHDINVSAAELAREFETAQWAEKLSEVIKSRSRLNPVVTQRLVEALRNAAKQLAALADQFGSKQKVNLPILGQCGGCSDMHEGIATLAKAHPEWDDQRLAGKSGCNVTLVRQAKTRHLYKREAA